MSNWNTDPEWNDPSEFNDGNEYQNRDGVRTTDMNKIVENVIYLFNHMPLDPTIPLDTPEISLSGNTLTITEVEGATKYGIYADGVLKHEVMSAGSFVVTYDMSTLNIYPGTYDIQVKAKGRGYKDSALSNTVIYTRENVPYIEFQSPYSFTIKTYSSNTKKWDGTIEMSYDGITWQTIENFGTSGYSARRAAGSDVYRLFFRGTGNTKITDTESIQAGSTYYYKGSWVISGTEVSCIGNIENLFDYQSVSQGVHPTMTSFAMYYLFRGNTSLVQAPEILFETVVSSCCYYMFSGCTSLRIPPRILPALTCESSCYSGMFNGCTNLQSAPELPATILASTCYGYMFQNCTALTTAPTLNAEVLAASCYYYMFYGCTSLVNVQANLPATVLPNSCYYRMFSECTSLVTAPNIAATTVNRYSCYYMFSGCTSLVTPPAALYATDIESTAAEYCYAYMFQGCTALASVPKIYATTAYAYCFAYMFQNCTTIERAPYLRITDMYGSCYYGMFNGCTNLKYIPDLSGINIGSGDSSCCANMFNGCTSVKLSTTQSEDYPYEYKIKGYYSSSSYGPSGCYDSMFSGTGGSWTGTPTNAGSGNYTTYYSAYPTVQPD